MIEPQLLTEVPAALKRLAKQVVRGFYGVEHALALDVLIRNPCVREEDMLELLKFDRKQLRSVLNTLKSDKFVKCRMRVETAPDGKTTRHNYYFINYRVLVNVVKYKLDHMRRRIETDERDSTNRASFRCPCCFSTFTDLEANQLFDPMTGTFRCTFCQTEVEEDESVCPDARTPVARFNEQIEPIYALLRETEDVNLSHDLLEPEPTEIPALKQSRERAAASAGNSAGGPHREAWSNKGSAYADLYTQNVVISMEEQEDQQKQANEGKAPKERPVWLTQSTVQGAYSEPDILKSRGDVVPGAQDGAAGLGIGQSDENEEVMRALLIHEKRGVAAAGGGGASAAAKGLTSATANASDSESDTSESDDDSPSGPPAATATKYRGAEEEEEEEDDDFEEVGDEPMVMVGGRSFSYREVSQRPELVEQMSAQEKEAYIEMGRNLFQDMYF
ncbi:general transcription factor IIE subunit 1 [Thunnus albacares]|uniref:general transcription factor IIE subunit 1 n=1 Tax=Thunnus maccoyii TaxID=8240 RepID=UPI001C4CA691|nr:general transcription factor IIE subunit 1 [Thunnus maccoyii]XP_042282845.1 general transcription factor IIE subunit 1 [Thunnus maccoyii]XP_044221220.1 general transcription factor IIE subunit 1 [Thunnus albacares]XP_044221221.1 general transcription factor IIE subunit 1 [Thunnus albacares]